MNKIKIIDLLNKLANGEEVPTKFTYKSFLWEYDIRSKMWFTYYQKNGETLNHRLDKLFFLNLCLNDEVEVVEEDIKENPTFEEYKENPEKYWNKLCKDLDEIKQLLEKF